MALLLTFAAGVRIGHAPLTFFYPAVVVAGWYGGRGPGFTAAVLSLLVAAFFSFPPAGSLRVQSDELPALAAFAMVVGLTGLLTGWLRDARRQAEERRIEAMDLADRLVGQAAELEHRANTASSLAALLMEAQELAHVGSWTWAIHANRVSWTDELYRIYGVEPGETESTYEGFLERVHADDRDRVRSAVELAFREHTPFNFVHRIVRPDGTMRIVHGRGRVDVDASGTPVRMSGTAQDITEQVEAEDNARELAAVLRARAEAEAAAQRLAFLAEASAQLGASLDYSSTLQQVARVAVPILGDWVAVHFVENDGTIRRVALETADYAHLDPAEGLGERDPLLREGGDDAVARAIRTGMTQIATEAPEGEVAASAQDEEDLRLLRALGLRSYVIAPLTADGRTFGALACAHSGRSHTSADVTVIEDVGRRAGAAIQSALQVDELESGRRELELQARKLRNQEARLERTLDQLEQTTAGLRYANKALAAQSREAERERAEAVRHAARLDEVARIMHAALRHETMDAVLRDILDQVQRVFGGTEATILLLDGNGHLRPRATRGLAENLARSVEIPLGTGMAGRVAAQRRSLVVPDTSKIDIVNPYLREHVRSLVAVPLALDQAVFGVLHVGSDAPRDFSDDDRAFLELVAERVASIIERARFFEPEHEARDAAEAARRGPEAANVATTSLS